MTKPFKNILKSNLHFKVNGSLWLECRDEKYFGPGPVELLERIEQTGSILSAAKQMGMSYKKAWEIISRLNRHAAKPLVETQVGGEKGGGSVISPEAKKLIDGYQKLRNEFEIFIKEQSRILF